MLDRADESESARPVLLFAVPDEAPRARSRSLHCDCSMACEDRLAQRGIGVPNLCSSTNRNGLA